VTSRATAEPGRTEPDVTGPAAPATTSRVPRLVVSDLDGTFLSPDGSVSALNREAVRLAREAGIDVLFATGRPVRWLEVIRDLPGAHATVIASNGAVLYDLATGTLLDRLCLQPEATVHAVRAIRAAVPRAGFAFETGSRFGYDPGYQRRREESTTPGVVFSAPAEELARSQDCVKMLVQDLTRSPDELLAAVLAVVGDTLTVTHSAASPYGLVEVSGPGVTKATMLQRWCGRIGIDRADVAAFGDMPNDGEMLSWAGQPHVVANAHPLLLAQGYPTVPANSESGVGQAIGRWARVARPGGLLSTPAS
jgi:hypothetical protein